MCGRFTLAEPERMIRELFPRAERFPDLRPRYNIAPSQEVAVVTGEEPDQLRFFRWGLIPSWSKNPAIGNRLMNARAETLGEKPSFRTAFRRRRCLIPADGFYEWPRPAGRSTGPGPREPVYFRLKSGSPFAMAGLWEPWRGREGPTVFSCTIVTTAANGLVANWHDRMPVILDAPGRDAWLDPTERPDSDLSLPLRSLSPDRMEAVRVSSYVNSPANDSKRCLEGVLL